MTPIQRLILIGKRINKYYSNGFKNVAWVEGVKTGDTPTAVEEIGDIYLEAIANTAVTHIGYVTDFTVNLTKIKKIFIDWENVGSQNSSNISYLVISTAKLASYSTYNALLNVYSNFNRQVTVLDVSALSGNYYLRFHARAGIGYESKLKVYRVWGES